MRLRPQDVSRRGLRPEYTELEDPILEVPNNGMVVLHVIYEPIEEENEGGVVVTVFPATQFQGDIYGMAQDVVSPGNEGVFIGPFPVDGYSDEQGHCFTAMFSAVRGVRVSALRISRT
jgi:hypothetical protein